MGLAGFEPATLGQWKYPPDIPVRSRVPLGSCDKLSHNYPD